MTAVHQMTSAKRPLDAPEVEEAEEDEHESPTATETAATTEAGSTAVAEKRPAEAVDPATIGLSA